MSDLEQSIMLRVGDKSDTSFIFSSWLKSYRNSAFARNISNTIYFSEHHDIIENLLACSDVVVACNKNDQSQIYGYIVASKINDKLTVHYIYVKHPFRRMGIGRYLLTSIRQDFTDDALYTHDTHISSRLSAKYKFSYHPYLMAVQPKSDGEVNE